MDKHIPIPKLISSAGSAPFDRNLEEKINRKFYDLIIEIENITTAQGIPLLIDSSKVIYEYNELMNAVSLCYNSGALVIVRGLGTDEV